MIRKPRTPDPARPTLAIASSALAVIGWLALFAGCKSAPAVPATHYVLVTSVAGYRIHASLDRPASLEPADDHAVITVGRHRLRVEKGWVVLDNNERAAFPTTATLIEITLTKSVLRMTADGKEMWRNSMPAD